ncbi:MAG: D-glucuronyl C5-epimerase family protein [Actinomycetota bacterium]|nr:D-glucuronyl C5-epimerase family protein [Actinomycetota bacterium]
MRHILRAWPGILAACLLVAFPATAGASRVLVLDQHGRTHVENDRFLSAADLPAPRGARSARTHARGAKVQAGATRAALQALLAGGQISPVDYQARLNGYNAAVATRSSLGGRSGKELGWVIENTDEIAQAGRLTAARLNPVFLVLDKNREYWSSSGALPAAGERVKFYGSLVLFQYYPGEGLQLQQLANWGKVNAYLNSGLTATALYLLKDLVPLGVARDGGVAWEYYFHYGGGRPPWTSSLSQGTAIQALVHAARPLHNDAYRSLALRSLRLFQLPPPTGVRKARGPGRVHYLIYSFASSYYVANAFIQSLNGLFDAGAPSLGNSAKARALFRLGDREARRELPRFDTGRWSRYSLSGEISTLSYHVLLRDFLRDLCDRTRTAVYCRYAQKFTRYLG